ncbi:M23 family metallopeptidase [Vibrio hepatarius]|uniref:M23 family metallopeptidase n=1 Tax=Vibrio hepatarius TaxID=171383 RepID=UPI001C09D545|nr:LysM peptidoglycan-binding domain-containing M23 family metallopeptidase [Vibrio hepatarius]MBU2896036.1 LysM peptidoglycan-binding domain-containing M23 family metallopeptidase [Vibrio hepatarius]
MTIVYNAALSVGAVGACFFSYITGLKLTGENNYEEFLFDSELGLNISTSSTDDFILEYPQAEVANEQTTPELTPSVNVPKNVSTNDFKINAESFGENNDYVEEHPQNDSKQVVDHTVKSGDSFISIARKAGVEADDLTNLLYRSGIPQSTFSLKKDQRIDFEFISKTLESVSIYDDSITYVKISSTKKGSYAKSKVKLPTSIHRKPINFQIVKNFSVDGLGSGLTHTEIAQVTDTLKSKLDFSALRFGVEVEAIFDREVVNKKIVSTLLKAVRVKVTERNIVEAYYFKTSNGAGYYDIDGKSVTPSFLRHPIDNPLITSRFNLHRKHPILDIVRPHWGTDYGHMGGTPIKAISDATVKFAGTKGGYGKAVILKHPQGIETLSAHMSKYGKGIKIGAKVKKGQVIGYVGKTGLSTGYHLHFELKKDGKRVDSLKIDLPTIDTVNDISRFKQEVGAYRTEFTG